MTPEEAQSKVLDWFEKEGRTAFPFQQAAWDAYLNGESGIVHSATGTGKTRMKVMGFTAEPLQFSSSFSDVICLKQRNGILKWSVRNFIRLICHPSNLTYVGF